MTRARRHRGEGVPGYDYLPNLVSNAERVALTATASCRIRRYHHGLPPCPDGKVLLRVRDLGLARGGLVREVRDLMRAVMHASPVQASFACKNTRGDITRPCMATS